MIPSTFRNIDALVEDKTLTSANGDNQNENEEDHHHRHQQQNTSSPFHPFSHQTHHHSSQSPSNECHQLPPPLDPVETRVTRW